MAAVAERNQDATVYVGGLDEKVTEHLLAELFIQGIVMLKSFRLIFGNPEILTFVETSFSFHHLKTVS